MEFIVMVMVVMVNVMVVVMEVVVVVIVPMRFTMNDVVLMSTLSMCPWMIGVLVIMIR